MADPRPFDHSEMLVTAARAVGKIDAHGNRGCTLVSVDEISAMACVLVLFGLIPIVPGATEIPDPLIVKAEV